MIPINVDYSYPDKPYHLATNLKQSSPLYYGGVNIFNNEDYIKINGFSNEFWGWGGEDDDLLNRIKSVNYGIYRKSGNFKSLYHKPNGPKHNNYKDNVTRCRTIYDYQSEGLNTLNYEIKSEEEIQKNIIKLNVCL